MSFFIKNKKGYSTIPSYDEKQSYSNDKSRKKRSSWLFRAPSRKGKKILFTFLFFIISMYSIHHFISTYIELALPFETASDLIKSIPSSDHLKHYFEIYASKPHLAGSEADFELANWTRDQFEKFGLETQVETFYPLLTYPVNRQLRLTNATDYVFYQASLSEYDGQGDDDVPTFHAYSANGNVTGPITYVNYGRAQDFMDLSSRNISCYVALVRQGMITRAAKIKNAENYGCRAVVIYTDPEDEGPDSNEKAYPKGPRRSSTSVERGSVEYLTVMPGDPSTPGYAATELNTTRLALNETTNLPKIPSLPISWQDAIPFLRAIEGHGERIPTWSGGIDKLEYYTGPSELQVNLVSYNDFKVKPIWNVMGRINGTCEPNKLVVIGNHRDAWGYGAVDPSSGSAVMMELVRSLHVLMERGWRPKRTIIIASWDAEEYGAVGSTEFTEKYKEELQANAVAYINVDHAVSGRHFEAQSSPLLNQLLYEVTRDILDPHTSESLFERWKKDRQVSISMVEPLTDPLSSDSDHVGFFHHLGIPSISMGFRGFDYGVRHSLYDDIHWMLNFGDPTFEYHQTLTKVWGLLVLHLSSDELLPFSPLDYVNEIDRLTETIARQQGCQKVPFVSSALTTLLDTCLEFDTKVQKLQHQLDKQQLRKHKTQKMKKQVLHYNERLLHFERALMETGGNWYRHIIYGPDPFTGNTVSLPWILESIRSKNEEQIKTAQVHLGTALLKAEKALRGYFPQL